MKLSVFSKLLPFLRCGHPRRRRNVAIAIAPMTFASILCVLWGSGTVMAAPKLTTIWTFTGGDDGAYPLFSSLLPGRDGTLFGTTHGGISNAGAAFQLMPPADGSTNWTISVLHSFTGGIDGGQPSAIVGDNTGNLFGEAQHGGDLSCNLVSSKPGCGAIFELSPPRGAATAWAETILFTFSGTDGAFPQTGLARDAAGNLFGTTTQTTKCFPRGCGVVFELSPPPAGQTTWSESTIYTFDKEVDGQVLEGTPILDASGALYGVAVSGGIRSKPHCGPDGQCGYGTVYKLTPPAQPGGKWAETTLWAFSGADGSYPDSMLHLDFAGNVLGLTHLGGLKGPCHNSEKLYRGCGTLFKLSPPTGNQGAWTLSTPWEFTGKTDGRYPSGAGLIPYEGYYLTTTSGDETHDFGSIDMFTPAFSIITPPCYPPLGPSKLCPQSQHQLKTQTWQEKTLFTFTNDANGANPQSGLLRWNDRFYGETTGDTPNGPAPYGTVYSLKP